MPNTDKTILLPQLQRYDEKIKGWADGRLNQYDEMIRGWADNKFLTKVNTPSLPPATSTTLGGVKVGSGLSVTNDGTLSAKTHGSETSITTSITATYYYNTGTWDTVCKDTYDVIVSLFDNYDRIFAWVNSSVNSQRPFPQVFVELIKTQEGPIVSTPFTIQYVAPSKKLSVKTGMTTTSLCQIYFNANDSIDFQESYSKVDQYADGTEFTNKVNGSVAMLTLKDGGITSAKLADSAVSSINIAPSAVTRTKIADDAIESNHIRDGQITVSHIKDGSVTSAKLALCAVNAENINEGAIVSANISDGAVKTAKLADGAVTVTKLASGAVDTDCIADGAITANKLASGIGGMKAARAFIQSGSKHSFGLWSVAVPEPPGSSSGKMFTIDVFYNSSILIISDVICTPSSVVSMTIEHSKVGKNHINRSGYIAFESTSAVYDSLKLAGQGVNIFETSEAGSVFYFAGLFFTV